VRGSRGNGWWRDLAVVSVICAGLAAGIGAGGVRAAESVASNIDLMQQLTAGVIVELHGKFGASVAGRGVRLRPAGTTEDYMFVTNVFREELTRLGVPTIDLAASMAPGDSLSTDALILQYQNVVFDLKYVDSHRAHLIGGKRVDRRASVRIMTTLSDPAGRVVWVGEAARDQSDEIDYSDQARIEQGTYQFNRPVAPSGGWGRYAEPVFVTGIIVGLIYLFFSNQSDN
jgi:hypothetical protein